MILAHVRIGLNTLKSTFNENLSETPVLSSGESCKNIKNRKRKRKEE